VNGCKILVTGATGKVALPVIEALSGENEVWAAARFSDSRLRERVEAAGAHPYVWDMTSRSDLKGLPTDFTHVLHAALLAEYENFERAIAATCESTGVLMRHCVSASAFLFVSSSVVYGRLEPGHPHEETDPLGGTSTPAWGPAYASTKIAAEGAVRALSAALGVPTTIARLSVQYGGDGGPSWARGGMPAKFERLIRSGRPVPVRKEGDDFCNLIHVDDIALQVPLLWEVASSPPTIVNWGGNDIASARDIASYIAELIDKPVEFEETDAAAGMIALDITKRERLIGPCSVPWREGIARLVTSTERSR
jgi:UDP-glucuronate 4-epimerase